MQLLRVARLARALFRTDKTFWQPHNIHHQSPILVLILIQLCLIGPISADSRPLVVHCWPTELAASHRCMKKPSRE